MNYLEKCTYTQDYDEDTYTFTGPCRKTGEPYSVTVKGPELFAFNQGKCVQDAFRSLDADQREFIITGYSPEGWALIFGGE